MKSLIIVFFLTCFAFTGVAQHTKIIDSLKRLEAIDYSNSRQGKSTRDSFITFDLSKVLIVIDGKIYAAGSNEYSSLKKEEIISRKIISDTLSVTGIQHILIISTKRKK
jgi:hypothetical protein